MSVLVYLEMHSIQVQHKLFRDTMRVLSVGNDIFPNQPNAANMI